MSPAAPCPERVRHLKHYHDAVRAYRVAVVSLDAGLAPNEFEMAYKKAEDAHALFEHSRQQLKAHVDAHGCQPNNGIERF